VKVLWLTPVQLPASKGRDATSGGWMEGLRRALEACEPDVDLTIASWGHIRHEPFRAGNAEYLCISSDDPAGGRLRQLGWRWRPPDAPPGAVEACRRIITRTQPDLIHVHGSESFLGLALGGTNVPSVISLQGIIHALLRHATTGLSPADWLRLSATRESIHGYGFVQHLIQYRSRARTELAIMGLCDAYLGRTDWDRAVLRAARPDARYHRIDEILNPVFARQAWEDPGPGAPLFCTSGSSPFKGLETLLEALAVLRRTTGRDVRLRVAGAVRDGPMWPVVRRMLTDPNLRGAVDLLGVVEPAALASELRQASLYVHPSHMDNSPNALCEAMLAGLPCVASFVGGIPSLVTQEETGLLFHDREPVMLAQAIERLLDDRSLATRLGAAGRVAALDRHDPERVAHTVARIYAEEISKRVASDV
jgi:glycosyltransferase involved in cell wall biosynthesis